MMFGVSDRSKNFRPLKGHRAKQAVSTSEHFDWFLRAEMDSFTLNTTDADHFGIFEVNGSVSCSSEIQGLLLHLRQQGRPCSIDDQTLRLNALIGS